jgi:hypothetical protein
MCTVKEQRYSISTVGFECKTKKAIDVKLLFSDTVFQQGNPGAAQVMVV